MKGAIIGGLLGLGAAYLQNKFNIDTNYGISLLQYSMAGGCLLGTISLRKKDIVKEYISFFDK